MKTRYILILFVTLFATQLYAGEKIVITNSGTTTMDAATAKKIFLGKKKKLDSGEKVKLATLKSGSAHEEFLTTIVKKRPDQFNIYWKQLMFTGSGVMPKSFDSDQALIDYVVKTSGAVGYISPEGKGKVPAGVNVITIQ